MEVYAKIIDTNQMFLFQLWEIIKKFNNLLMMIFIYIHNSWNLKKIIWKIKLCLDLKLSWLKNLINQKKRLIIYQNYQNNDILKIYFKVVKSIINFDVINL